MWLSSQYYVSPTEHHVRTFHGHYSLRSPEIAFGDLPISTLSVFVYPYFCSFKSDFSIRCRRTPGQRACARTCEPRPRRIQLGEGLEAHHGTSQRLHYWFQSTSWSANRLRCRPSRSVLVAKKMLAMRNQVQAEEAGGLRLKRRCLKAPRKRKSGFQILP